MKYSIPTNATTGPVKDPAADVHLSTMCGARERSAADVHLSTHAEDYHYERSSSLLHENSTQVYTSRCINIARVNSVET